MATLLIVFKSHVNLLGLSVARAGMINAGLDQSLETSFKIHICSHDSRNSKFPILITKSQNHVVFLCSG